MQPRRRGETGSWPTATQDEPATCRKRTGLDVIRSLSLYGLILSMSHQCLGVSNRMEAADDLTVIRQFGRVQADVLDGISS